MTVRFEEKEPIFKDLKERQDAYRELFERTPLGKKVLEDLLQFSGVDRSAYTEDANQTHINLGLQMMGYHLKNTLDVELIEKESKK
ncbi:MAG: hypothetical protein MK137_06045 [Rickettsiales bacterium]|nr:hypothetical protein [Rickettsiales bacterium]